MKNLTDYSLVVLSEYEQTLFNRFRDSNFVELDRAEFRVLRNKELVTGAINGKSDWFDELPDRGKCAISPFGKGLRAYQKQKERDERTIRIRHWVPVLVSSLLSIVAIVISVIALLGQLGILQFQP